METVKDTTFSVFPPDAIHMLKFAVSITLAAISNSVYHHQERT